MVRGREIYYAHALAASNTDGKFCMRDIAAKTDAAAREGCYEKSGALEAKSGALEAKSGADKKRNGADLLAKEQRAASETQRDFAALKKSKKSNIAAKAASGADEKYNTRDFAASGTDGNLTGYAGGIDRKIKLLQPGGIDMRGLFTSQNSTAP